MTQRAHRRLLSDTAQGERHQSAQNRWSVSNVLARNRCGVRGEGRDRAQLFSDRLRRHELVRQCLMAAMRHLAIGATQPRDGHQYWRIGMIGREWR